MTNGRPSSLSPEQFDILHRHYRLTAQPSQDRRLSVPSLDLLDEAKCSAYLSELERVFPAAPVHVRASLFAKRYGCMVAAPSLYALTMFDKALDCSINLCHIESAYRDETWIPNLRLTDWRVAEVEAEHRNEWRDKVIQTIFAGHLAKVWRTLSKTARIPIATLWENTAVYVYWLYEKRIGEEASAQQQIRLQEDFRYLLQAPAALFGEKENPLARFYFPKRADSASGAPVRIRETCCLYYLLAPDRACCSVCPRNRGRS
jgi:ferric iron reductase protein FhuF